MKWQKGKMAVILSHYEELNEHESIVKSFIKDVEKKINGLLKKQNPSITLADHYLGKDEINKCLKKLSKEFAWALSDVEDIPLDKLKSDVINIDVLRSMPNEVDSIKAGDTVIAIVPEGNVGKKRYIIEFEVLLLDFITPNALGISSYESPFSGMLEIEWCELVVKKESYLNALQSQVTKSDIDFNGIDNVGWKSIPQNYSK